MPVPRPESIVRYQVLRARKAYLGICSQDLVAQGHAWDTVSGFFNGAETLNLSTIKELAAKLGLRVIVDFKPIEEDQH